jgi:hypothetical protein
MAAPNRKDREPDPADDDDLFTEDEVDESAGELTDRSGADTRGTSAGGEAGSAYGYEDPDDDDADERGETENDRYRE